MAVEIRVAVLKLVNVNSQGQIINKSNPTTTLADLKAYAGTDFRVVRNGTGSSESPNADTTGKTIEEYLELEAADDFALAVMDQSRVITQKIT